MWGLHLERTTEDQLVNCSVLLYINPFPCVGFQWQTVNSALY